MNIPKADPRAQTMDSGRGPIGAKSGSASDPPTDPWAHTIDSSHHKRLVTTTGSGSAASETPPPVVEFAGTERYEVKRRLGAGGMGMVYEVLDRDRHATVALKTLLHVDAEGVYGLKREFRSLADTRHPNLVRLYDLVANNDHCFFTMQLVAGGSFTDYCRPGSGDVADLDRLRSTLRQLTDGVSALHAAGIVHRDLKPSNVMVTPEGRVVILDFGLAVGKSQASEEKDDGRVSGTPAYMSPEQARGAPATEASDWYAVGAMIFVALTGRLPFEGSLVNILLDKQMLDAPAPSSIVSGLPADLDEVCRALLARVPEQRMAGVALLRRLDNAVAALSAVPREASNVFVGRTAVLSTLKAALTQSRDGDPVLFQVHGPSGIGKSSLLERFFNDVRAAKGTVLIGRCYERESVPYKAFDELIDELSRYLLQAGDAAELVPPDVLALLRVFPVLGRVPEFGGAPGCLPDEIDPQELRRRSSTALKELLRRIASRAPLVLAVDDAQWGDADSAALASELLSAPGAPGAVILLSYRTDEASRSPFLKAIGDAARSARGHIVGLEPLDKSEALELARTLLGQEAVERAGNIAANAEGSPLFIRELALQAPTEQLGENATDLESMLAARIDRLPADARRALEAVAVAARPLHQAIFFGAGQVTDREGALDALYRARLVRAAANPDELYTYHDRVRHTVVRQLDAERLRATHQRIADTLEATGRGNAEMLATHHHGAGNDARASQYAATAGDEAAAALAFDQAAELYQHAFEWAPEPKPEGLRRKAAQALSHAGRCYEAAQRYLEAAAAAKALEAVELQSLAAEQFLRAGHQDKGAETLRPALIAIGLKWPEGKWSTVFGMLGRTIQLKLRGIEWKDRGATELPAETLARIEICGNTAWGLSGFEFLRPTYFTARYLLLALKAGTSSHVARGILVQAVYAAWGGDPTWGYELQRRGAELAEQLNSAELRALSKFSIGCIASTEARWNEAQQRLDEGLAIFRSECKGVAFEVSLSEWFAQWSLWQTGNMHELTRRGLLWIKEGRARGDIVAELAFRGSLSPYIYLAADTPDAAEKELSESIGGFPPRAAEWSPYDHWAQLVVPGTIALYRGDGPRGWQTVVESWPKMKRSLILNSRWHRIEAMFVRARCAMACALAASPDEAKRMWREAERAAKKLEGEKLAWPKALAALVRANLALARGDRTGAAANLEAAAQAFDAHEMALHAAVARRRLGELDGATGAARVAESNAQMAARGIKDPERWARMLSPVPVPPLTGGA